MNVREKLSLCYYCNSSLNRFDGVMTVCAGIDAKNSAKAQKAILQQIEDIKNGVISDDEMTNAVKANYSTYISFNDDTSSLCGFYLSRLLYGIYRTPEEECASSLASVREEAIRIAQTIKLDTVYLLKGISDA